MRLPKAGGTGEKSYACVILTLSNSNPAPHSPSYESVVLLPISKTSVPYLLTPVLALVHLVQG